MNARISPAHLGSAGGALDVLAGSVQQLAVECKERSGVLVEVLRLMSDAAIRLSGQADSETGGEPTGQNGPVGEMRLAVADLHSSSERSFAQISQIVVRSSRLGEDLSAARKSLSVGALFATDFALHEITFRRSRMQCDLICLAMTRKR
jgi:hypothetical protein